VLKEFGFETYSGPRRTERYENIQVEVPGLPFRNKDSSLEFYNQNISYVQHPWVEIILII
jgi:hypothetical protein